MLTGREIEGASAREQLVALAAAEDQIGDDLWRMQKGQLLTAWCMHTRTVGVYATPTPATPHVPSLSQRTPSEKPGLTLLKSGEEPIPFGRLMMVVFPVWPSMR
jgi:hypothetical protein